MDLPHNIAALVGCGPLEGEDMGRSGAQVLRCADMFLKIDSAGKMARSAKAQEYFAKKGLSAPLVAYETDAGRDYLLVRAVPGAYACAESMLKEPEKLAALLGETIRMLHETDAADCPLRDTNERLLQMYADENGCPFPGNAGCLEKDALVQGDCCLPNIFFENGRFSGFIDLGEAGIGDRHADLCCAVWSLGYNTGSDAWGDTLLDAYGRDKVDEERLAICRQFFGY